MKKIDKVSRIDFFKYGFKCVNFNSKKSELKPILVKIISIFCGLWPVTYGLFSKWVKIGSKIKHLRVY